MFVDIELFSDNPVDNVISSLKFKFDKVIFLSSPDETIEKVSRETISRFLKSDRVGVSEVNFINIIDADYEEIKERLAKIIFEETALGNQCYMDLTGGDEVVLAAVGSVATEKDIPIHEIAVDEDEIHILSHDDEYENLPRRDIYMNIEEYLNLHEAVIDWGRHKIQNEQVLSDEHKEKVDKIFKLSTILGRKWNKISIGLANMCSGKYGCMEFSTQILNRAAKTAGIKTGAFVKELEKMYRKGYLKKFYHSYSIVKLEFFDEEERALFCDPGAVLEHYACCKVSEDPEINDCMIGCFMNWEGEGDPNHIDRYNDDVINEVDVVYMKKNIPTFISCKNKYVSSNSTLYELETVANRFGGESVRKVLFAKDGVSAALQNRADEMGIKVITTM